MAQLHRQRSRSRPHFALPKNENPPASCFEGRQIGGIPLDIPGQLGRPPLGSGVRQDRVPTARVPMPKTAADLHHRMAPRQDDVGPPGEITAMKPETVSECVEELSDDDLWGGVPRTHSAHVRPARGRNVLECRARQLAAQSALSHTGYMPLATKRGNERRWIVLGEDGRYVTLGRGSDPTEAEITAAEEALRAGGMAGWLAVMQGNPYVGKVPSLMEVRPLASPTAGFLSAASACIHQIVGMRHAAAARAG